MSITGKHLLVAALAMLLAGCDGRAIQPARVDPAHHTAFYLWSGVEPHPRMEEAEAVYLLWGELRRNSPDRIVALRRTVPTGDSEELWLVVRAERLDWSESAHAQLLEAAKRWNREGRLTGVQVDFDSSTGRLGDYAAFLAEVRNRLPDRLKLSATGLMDWSAHASDSDLAAVRGVLDEIVIQTYRATTTIPDYQRYLASTPRLDMPYRIALVEGGEWDPPTQLERDPNFRGYVVFLLGQRVRQKS